MKSIKRFPTLLASTSGFALFSSLSFAATTVHVEDNLSYWGRAKNIASSTAGSVKSFMGSAAVATKDFVVEGVDETVKQQISTISESVSDLTQKKIRQIVYGNKDLDAEIDEDGKKVNIFDKQSQLISNFVKSVTGTSINEMINNLPFGFKQTANLFKVHVEKAVVNMISDMTIKPAVKKLVELTLSKTYAESKNIAYDKFTNLFNSKEDNKSESNNPIVSETIFPFNDLSQQELTAEFDNAEKNTLNVQERILLTDIFNKYIYDIKSFLNHQIYQTIDENLTQIVDSKISFAAESVVSETKELSKSILGNYRGRLFNLAVSKAIPFDLKNFYSNQAHKVLDPIVDFSKQKIGSLDLLSINQEHAGKATFTEVEDDFLSLDIQVPTFSAYAAELANLGKRKVLETVQNGVNQVKDVVKDFDGKAGVQAVATHFHTQFAGPAPSVVWDSPVMTNSSHVPSYYESKDFEKYLSTDPTQVKNEGTLNKLKSWFSW